MRCHTHTDTEAVGVCTVCGHGVCEGCGVNVGGQIRCKSCLATSSPEKFSGPLFSQEAQLKEPAFALMLSILHGGFGQFYNGEIKKGILILVSKVVAIIIGIVFLFVFWPLGLAIIIFGWVPLWIYGMYDAYVSCVKLNKRIKQRGPQIGPAFSDGVSEIR